MTGRTRQKVTKAVTIGYCHTPAESDFNCKHNTLDCQHHPILWTEYENAEGVWTYKPVYFTSPPEEIEQAREDAFFAFVGRHCMTWKDEFEEMC
jgi:hypothetical protein